MIVGAAACAHDEVTTTETCADDDGAPIACERMPDDDNASVVASPSVAAKAYAADEASPVDPTELAHLVGGVEEIDMATDPEVAGELATRGAGSPSAGTAIDPGPTDTAELRKLLPIGKTAGVTRYVLLRLRPSDLPKLAVGDTLRTAAELQLTTRCDIGQTGPGCGYTPHVRMQLVLSGSADGTNGKALSDVKKFDCNSDDHHCVPVIDFHNASLTIGKDAPPCIASDSCYVNLVVWAYNENARSDGQDKLIVGANEGNFLDNGKLEQDRARIMAVRERDLAPGDVTMRATKHNVKSNAFSVSSGDPERPLYVHPVNGGHDLKAGEKYRIWAEVDASSNHRVNLSLEMFLSKNPHDANGGSIDGTYPQAISEHNGTNCSPGNDCHLRKVAVFEAKKDIKGPVFVIISGSTDVPGPGSAVTRISDSGFIKEVKYAR